MITSKAELTFYLRADLAAHGLERWRARYRLTHRIVYYQRLLRYTEFYENCSATVLGRLHAKVLQLRLHLLGERLGFTIPRKVFGPGLSIAHKGTIVVNGGTRVGRNCRIHQCVTIGSSRGHSPVLGDNVMLGAGACIIGAATIGDRAVVGANTVVTGNVEADVVVAGNPAQVVSQRGSREFVPDWCASVLN